MIGIVFVKVILIFFSVFEFVNALPIVFVVLYQFYVFIIKSNELSEYSFLGRGDLFFILFMKKS